MPINEGLATFGTPIDEGYWSVAPYGTTLPTTSTEELAQAFETVKVGEDGWTPSVDLGKDDPKTDWSGNTSLSTPAKPSATVEVPIFDNGYAANKIKYGAANATANGGFTFDGTTDAWSLVFTELHNDENGELELVQRYVFAYAVPREIELGTHKKDELVIDTVTFDAMYDSGIGGYFKALDPVAQEG